jgi:hypothetical protein
MTASAKIYSISQHNYRASQSEFIESEENSVLQPRTSAVPPAGKPIYGDQINVTAGLTRVLTPNFLVGVLGGWGDLRLPLRRHPGPPDRHGLDGRRLCRLKLSSTVRFDAGVAYSGIGFDGTAGTASGSFAISSGLSSGA